MIVCHCKAVTDRQVRDAMSRGACTRRQVARRCGAGSVCGGCRPLVDEILSEGRAPERGAELELSLSPAR